MNAATRRRSFRDRPLRRQVREGRLEDAVPSNQENDGRRQYADAAMGPYEVRYDISLGYGQERSILIP